MLSRPPSSSTPDFNNIRSCPRSTYLVPYRCPVSPVPSHFFLHPTLAFFCPSHRLLQPSQLLQLLNTPILAIILSFSATSASCLSLLASVSPSSAVLSFVPSFQSLYVSCFHMFQLLLHLPWPFFRLSYHLLHLIFALLFVSLSSAPFLSSFSSIPMTFAS